MQRAELIGKDPDAGKDWGQEEERAAKDRWLDSITNSMDLNLSKLQETAKDRGAWLATVHGQMGQGRINWKSNLPILRFCVRSLMLHIDCLLLDFFSIRKELLVWTLSAPLLRLPQPHSLPPGTLVSSLCSCTPFFTLTYVTHTCKASFAFPKVSGCLL